MGEDIKRMAISQGTLENPASDETDKATKLLQESTAAVPDRSVTEIPNIASSENGLLNHRYELLSLISENYGGRTVYLALDMTSNNQVHIKEYKMAKIGKEAIDETLKAYEQEKNLNASLHKIIPLVPDVIDSFQQGTELYLVLESKQGMSLEEVVKKKCMLLEGDVLGLGLRLLDELNKAHTSHPPVIHRDLKPEHVLVDEKLSLTGLLDFSAAGARVYSTNTMTRSVYSPFFTAIEALAGNGVDPRTDYYSIGAVMFYLLTHKKPDDTMPNNRSTKTLDKIMKEANVAKDTRNIIVRLMQNDPKQRYQEHHEVEEALSTLLKTKETSPSCISLSDIVYPGHDHSQYYDQSWIIRSMVDHESYSRHVHKAGRVVGTSILAAGVLGAAYIVAAGSVGLWKPNFAQKMIGFFPPGTFMYLTGGLLGSGFGLRRLSDWREKRRLEKSYSPLTGRRYQLLKTKAMDAYHDSHDAHKVLEAHRAMRGLSPVQQASVFLSLIQRELSKATERSYTDDIVPSQRMFHLEQAAYLRSYAKNYLHDCEWDMPRRTSSRSESKSLSLYYEKLSQLFDKGSKDLISYAFRKNCDEFFPKYEPDER